MCQRSKANEQQSWKVNQGLITRFIFFHYHLNIRFDFIFLQIMSKIMEAIKSLGNSQPE